MLGFQVLHVVRVSLRNDDRNSIHDVDPQCTQPFHLSRVIGHEFDAADIHVGQDGWHGTVLTSVIRESQSPICVDRVATSILHGVCCNFIRQTNPSSFLLKVYDGPAVFTDVFHGQLQLLFAIAPLAAEYLRRHALVVHTNRHALFQLSIRSKGHLVGAVYHARFRSQVVVIDAIHDAIRAQAELSHVRRQSCVGDVLGGEHGVRPSVRWSLRARADAIQVDAGTGFR
mmetsp:Transcript_8418/g.24277  ORF Transcript_8418/g.24277 Transcript_8418/m.24277 type:complete len:228 (+) Transcript_8418:388-1071(+)